MRFRPLIGLLLWAVTAPLFAQSAQHIQDQLMTQANLLKTWMADEAFVSAAKAQNARHVPLADVQKIEKEWLDGKQQKLSDELTAGPCADRLRKLMARFPAFENAFVMDHQGVVVCATFHVDDYWKGDETKWQRAYNGGKGAAFVDRPRFDPSAGKPLAQISVPVLDGSAAVGTITVGIDTRKLAMVR